MLAAPRGLRRSERVAPESPLQDQRDSDPLSSQRRRFAAILDHWVVGLTVQSLLLETRSDCLALVAPIRSLNLEILRLGRIGHCRCLDHYLADLVLVAQVTTSRALGL